MLGAALPPLRPQLAAAQRSGQVGTEQVAIVERAVARADQSRIDPAAVDAGGTAAQRARHPVGPKDLKILADRVVDYLDPDGSRPDEERNATRRFLHLRSTTDGAYTGEFRLTGEARSN